MSLLIGIFLAMPKLLGNVLDQYSNKSSNNSSTLSSRGFYAVVLGGGLASWLRTVSLNRVQQNLECELRKHVFETQLLSPTKDPAEVSTIWQQDIPKVAQAMTTTFANVLRSSCSCFFAIYNMIQLDASLVCYSATLVPMVGAAAMILQKAIEKQIKQHRQAIEDLFVHADERLHNVELIQLSCRGQHEIDTFQKQQQILAQHGKSVAWKKGGLMGFLFASSATAFCALFRAGGKSVSSGKITQGQLSSFATYTFLLGLGTSGLIKAMTEWKQAINVAAPNIFLPQALNSENEDKEETKKEQSLDVSQVKAIQLHSVTFSYNSDDVEKETIKDISFSLSRGKIVALVGENGSGKTTIARLLASLHKPKQGTIQVELMNGTKSPLIQFTRNEQSKLVQVVTQRPALLNMSIEENIKYSNDNVTDDEVKKAMEKVQLPYDDRLKVVGRNGDKLSGGQRQRVALARAFCTEPFCIVLDEPTSAMDVHGEESFQTALQSMTNKETKDNISILLISHKISTLQLADEILVLGGDGKITQRFNQEDFQKHNSNNNGNSFLSEIINSTI